MSLLLPKLVREGDDFLFLWRESNLAIEITNLREHHSDFNSEIAVMILDADGVPTEEVLWQKLNLSASRSRTEVATSLQKKGYESFDWWNMIDYVARKATVEFRRGGPTIDLSTLDVSPQPSYLVSRVLPENETTIVYADGGSGKSFLSMAFCLAVRAGLSLPNGLVPSKQGPILYVDYETTEETQARRLKRLSAGFELRSVPQVHYRRSYRSIMDDKNEIRAEMRKIGAIMVVIDSLLFACGDDPLAAGVAIRAMNAIRDLGGTRMVLSHVPRSANGPDQAGNRVDPFGSVLFRNAARSAWEMRKSSQAKGRLDVALFNRKVNDDAPDMDPIGLSFRFERDGGPVSVEDIRVAADKDLRRYLPLNERLAETLSNGEVWPIRALADEVETSERTVVRALRDLPNVRITTGKGRGNLTTCQLVDPGADELPWADQQ